MNMHNPAHPGFYFRMAYLEPLNMSVSAFALRIGVTRKAASELVNSKTSVSLEMAHRLAKVTATDPDFWLTMQMHHDLWQAKQNKLGKNWNVEEFDLRMAAG